MKMVHSYDIAAMALEKGASVSTGAARINAARQQAPAPPTPVPTVSPQTQDAIVDLVKVVSHGQQKQDQLASLLTELVREIRVQQAPQKASPATPIKAWDFHVEYDDSYPVKRLQRIRAIAIR